VAVGCYVLLSFMVQMEFDGARAFPRGTRLESLLYVHTRCIGIRHLTGMRSRAVFPLWTAAPLGAGECRCTVVHSPLYRHTNTEQLTGHRCWLQEGWVLSQRRRAAYWQSWVRPPPVGRTLYNYVWRISVGHRLQGSGLWLPAYYAGS
jgi:hypothetical protein